MTPHLSFFSFKRLHQDNNCGHKGAIKYTVEVHSKREGKKNKNPDTQKKICWKMQAPLDLMRTSDTEVGNCKTVTLSIYQLKN